MRPKVGSQMENDYSFVDEDISEQQLLPDVHDPNLWIAKCVIGTEKECALKLMRKFIVHQSKDDPLQIKSVIAPEGSKGFVYIEAYKRTHVKQSVEGINFLRMAIYDQEMVPTNQMKDVLRVIKSTQQLKPGMWVRLKRGIYKDDLAQVDYVEAAQNQVSVKTIPRIDYNKARGFNSVRAAPRAKNQRPQQKLFNEDSIRAIGGDISNDGDFLIFEGARYSRKGYLYKTMKMELLQIEGVKPTLAELEKFEDNPDSVDLDLDDRSSKTGRTHSFAPGDMVQVAEGELMHLEGKVISIDRNKVTMMPKHQDLTEALEFPANELRKFFKVGDHVKVIAGRYEGDTGLVVRVEDMTAVVFSDLTMHELKVRPEDLQFCTEKSSGVDKLGKFQFSDMVQIDNQNVGVIIRLEKDAFQILNQQGKVKRFRAAQIQRRRDAHMAVALDGDQNPIRKNDKVKVIDGPFLSREGEVKHLYRGFCFIYNRKHMENGGLFVCRSKHLSLAGSSSTTSNAANFVPMSPRIAASPKRSDGGKSPWQGGGVQKSQRDTKIIGLTIRIIKGPYKGNVGIVKDATPNDCRIELHANPIIITVKRSNISVVNARGHGDSGRTGHTLHTPGYGSNSTPAYHGGARTPAYGSTTPRADGSRTPSYGQDGSRTPQYQDGGRTPQRDENPWNSKMPNTPRDDFGEFDNPTTPGTPSFRDEYPPASSPAYAPQTPQYEQGGSSTTPFSMNPTPSPGGSYGGASITPSPGYGTGPTPSPGGYNPTPSPGGYTASPSPSAAFTPTLYSPALSPAMFGDNSSMANDWHAEDIEVTIQDSHDESSHRGKMAVIKTISGPTCSVWIPATDQTISVGIDNMTPVQPLKNHKVKVLHGDDIGHTGELISIDGNDGIVRMDQDKQLKILQLKFLGKLFN